MAKVGLLVLAAWLGACRFDGAPATPDSIEAPDGEPLDAPDGSPDGAPPDVSLACLAAEISAGAQHTCARMQDGSLLCWGRDDEGQLGYTTTEKCLVGGTEYACHALPAAVALAGVTTLGLGSQHGCAATGTSTYCWGQNSFGAYGDGTSGSAAGGATPRLIPQRGAATAIAAGVFHTCSIANGNVACSGRNSFGEVGNNSQFPQPIAVQVRTNAAEIAAGDYLNCVIGPGNGACWGNGTRRPSESSIIAMSDQTGSGRAHACWLVGGVVSCQGQNNQGQLGDGTTVNRNQPVTFGVPDVVELVAHGDHTCVRTSSNAIRCVGEGYGLTPQTIAMPATPVSITAGLAHDCAIVDDGSVWCWGGQEFGQLGDGTISSMRTLVPRRAQICP